jgi:hypothetical protein
MGLTRNTLCLLSRAAEYGEPVHVEYALLSEHELFDTSIISPDPRHSSAGEWLIRGDRHFYTVTVSSRPSNNLPQHLTLHFDCFSQGADGHI